MEYDKSGMEYDKSGMGYDKSGMDIHLAEQKLLNRRGNYFS